MHQRGAAMIKRDVLASAQRWAERRFANLTFKASCNGCGKEIVFLLFTCLGCRNYVLCETCYFDQLTEFDQPEVTPDMSPTVSPSPS